MSRQPAPSGKVGSIFRLKPSGRRRHGFSRAARLQCVEDGAKAAVFQALDTSGKRWGTRWVIEWKELEVAP